MYISEMKDKNQRLLEIISYDSFPFDYISLKKGALIYLKHNQLDYEKYIDLKNQYIGIEIEAENLPDALYSVQGKILNSWPMDLILKGVWKIVEDGSLRNNGVEFVSIPIKGPIIAHALHSLLEELKSRGADFSERTSIHIHVDFRHKTIEDLVKFLMVYFIVEKPLYDWLKKKEGISRFNNIFCVPLSESFTALAMMSILESFEAKKFRSMFDNIAVIWKKYSGLNLLPIHKKGTIEFRQLAGTNDYVLIMSWISLIMKLISFVTRKNYEELKTQILALNTNSQYNNFLFDVFGHSYNELITDYSSNDIERSVLLIKNCYQVDNRKIDSNFESSLYFKILDGKQYIIKRNYYAIYKELRDFYSYLDSDFYGKLMSYKNNPSHNNNIIFEEEQSHLRLRQETIHSLTNGAY